MVPDTWGLINDQASCLDTVWLQPRVHAWLQLVILVMFAWAPAVWAGLTYKVWAVSRRKGMHVVHCLQDAVARTAKFVLLFKRPGQRVMINVKGDLIVRPSYAEANLQRTLAGGQTKLTLVLCTATQLPFGLSRAAACRDRACPVALVVHTVHCLTAMPCGSCLQQDLMSTHKHASAVQAAKQCAALPAISSCRGHKCLQAVVRVSFCDAQALVPLLALQVTVCRTTC